MRTLVLLLAASILVAGCVGSEEPAALVPGGADSGAGPGTGSGASPPGSAPSSPSGNGSSGGNPSRTQDPKPNQDGSAPAAARMWPALEDAVIRPGVQVLSETGQCTSNFVFTSPDNESLYLGLAAHCVDGLPLGSPMDVAGGAATGTLYYSSWATMDEVDEKDADAREYNDFALVLLPSDARDLVHPAMRHFGGPTALASSSDVLTGDKVVTYGNSGLRFETEPLSWHEGYVLARGNDWTTTVYTATPGIPGDSGSGVLLGDGRALGVLVTITIAPTAGSNGVTHLDTALAYAKQHAGIDARLATWELLDGGLLPPV